MPVPNDAFTEEQKAVRAVRRKALAAAVIKARHKAKLSQNELAEKSGLSRSAIIRLEKGHASLSSDRLWDLARAMGTRPSALFLAAEDDDAAAETLGDQP